RLYVINHYIVAALVYHNIEIAVSVADQGNRVANVQTALRLVALLLGQAQHYASRPLARGTSQPSPTPAAIASQPPPDGVVTPPSWVFAFPATVLGAPLHEMGSQTTFDSYKEPSTGAQTYRW